MRYLVILLFTLLFSQNTPFMELDTAFVQSLVTVPNLVDNELERARDILQEVGLRVGELREEISDSEAGIVLWQRPKADDTVRIKSTVDLGISSGPVNRNVEMVIVPSVVGYTIEEAEGILLDAQLHVGDASQSESDAESGTILEQIPLAGDTVPVKSRVDLVIAVKHEIIITPGVLVPSVVRHNLAQAKEILREVRLHVGEIDEEMDDSEPGTIIKQNPRAGTRVPVGTPVHLVLAKRKTAPMPWIYGGLVIALGFGGFFLVRHLAKAKKYVKSAKSGIQLKPNKDFGIQHVESDTSFQFDLHVRLKPICDNGSQMIDTEKPSVIDEGNNNE